MYSNSAIPGQELPRCPGRSILSDTPLLVACTSTAKPAEICLLQTKTLALFSFPCNESVIEWTDIQRGV